MAQLRISTFGWAFIAAGLSLFIGLRYQVGGDWNAYISYITRASQASLLELLSFDDPGYWLVNGLSIWLGFGVWFVNLFSAAVFSIGLVLFVRRMPAPALALVVSIPYMVIVLAMGYTRQAVALGFIMWGLTYLLDQRIRHFMVMLFLAAIFHKSAVILAPLAVLANTQNRIWTGLWVAVSGLMLYWLFLAEKVTGLWQNYVEAEYGQSSEGGPVRVAMNVVPAVLFLMFRKRFHWLAAEERMLWFWVSAFAILCLPLVFQAPTAVDRVALYFMPIQLVVFGSIPRLVSAGSGVLARGIVIAFYGLVQFVWLNYAQTAFAWLPYRFWPLAGG